MAATAAASAAPEDPEDPVAGPRAARATRAAATAAVSPTRGRPTVPAAVTPTNRRSKSNKNKTTRKQVTAKPRRGRGSKEHHDGQATTAQAEEEGLRVLPGADRLRRLQGHRPAP